MVFMDTKPFSKKHFGKIILLGCFLDLHKFLQTVWGILNILQPRKADEDCSCQTSNCSFLISLCFQQQRKILLTWQSLFSWVSWDVIKILTKVIEYIIQQKFAFNKIKAMQLYPYLILVHDFPCWNTSPFSDELDRLRLKARGLAEDLIKTSSMLSLQNQNPDTLVTELYLSPNLNEWLLL